MIDFTIKLAGIPVHASVLFPSTKDFCKDYLTEDEAKVSVSVSTEDILEEQRIIQEAADGSAAENSREYLELFALYRKVLAALLPYGIIMLHGAAVAVDGKVYIFTAESGVGKTTHTQLWIKNIPGAYYLNGDKPLLRFSNGKVIVCGTPWEGKESFGINSELELTAICLLERSPENFIEKISFKDAFDELIKQVHHPAGKFYESTAWILKLSDISMYRLGCNMEDEAALTAFRGMQKQEST